MPKMKRKATSKSSLIRLFLQDQPRAKPRRGGTVNGCHRWLVQQCKMRVKRPPAVKSITSGSVRTKESSKSIVVSGGVARVCYRAACPRMLVDALMNQAIVHGNREIAEKLAAKCEPLEVKPASGDRRTKLVKPTPHRQD